MLLKVENCSNLMEPKQSATMLQPFLIVLFETLNFECARTMKNVSRQRVSRLSADIFDLTTPCLVVFIHFSLLCKNSVFQNKTAIETDKRS